MGAIADRADLVLMGGPVHTVDRANRIARAVAVAGDRIVAVGSETEVRALVDAGTRLVELRGRPVLPGFIDAHCHPTGLGNALASIDCKAPGMNSIAALTEAIRARAAAQPPGTWIRATGYDQSKLAERRHPNRLDLDPVSPHHPVLVTRTCSHILVVNSRAMALAGVDDATPDPPGGRFDRADGRNLGVVYEEAQAAFRRVSAPTQREMRDAILRAQAVYLAAGATSVHDAGLLPLHVAQELNTEGVLRLRFYVMGFDGFGFLGGTALVESGLHTGFGDDRLRIGAYKVVTDGSSSGPTAATREPYACNSSDSGILYQSHEELAAKIRRAHRAGFQVTMHAVGDRAVANGLDAIAAAVDEFPRERLRHRIEHCAILPPDLQRRVRDQGIVPVMQPAFFWEFGDGYVANYGRHRADVMFPVRSLLDAGVVVAGSSDAPVTNYRPLFGIQQAMTRATMSGDVCGPEERVDLATAIRMHTTNAAYAAFEENQKGRIAPGMLADLVVLGDDISRVPVEELCDIPVAMTIVGGVVEHEA